MSCACVSQEYFQEGYQHVTTLHDEGGSGGGEEGQAVENSFNLVINVNDIINLLDPGFGNKFSHFHPSSRHGWLNLFTPPLIPVYITHLNLM